MDPPGPGDRLGRSQAGRRDHSRVVARGDVIWADLGGSAGTRPVCILTRGAAIAGSTSVTCAPITRTIRGIRSEVEVGPAEGLPTESVITCDNVLTIPADYLVGEPLGHLDRERRAALDAALRYALDIRY